MNRNDPPCQQEQQKQTLFDARMPEVMNILNSTVCSVYAPENEGTCFNTDCLAAVNKAITDLTGSQGICTVENKDATYTGKIVGANDYVVFQQVGMTLCIHNQNDMIIPIRPKSRTIGENVRIHYEQGHKAKYDILYQNPPENMTR